jgi:arsenate reductase
MGCVRNRGHDSCILAQKLRQEAIVRIVLFACVHNAGRSQMAAAWFNKLCDPSRARALSAGTQPSDSVHRVVVEAMREVDIDLSQQKPQLLTDKLAREAQLLVTMGCGDACPFVPGLEKLDWPVPDPRGELLVTVRKIRDDIRARVLNLALSRGWL